MEEALQPKPGLGFELQPIGPLRSARDPRPMTHNVAIWLPCTLTELIHGNLAVFITQYNRVLTCLLCEDRA